MSKGSLSFYALSPLISFILSIPPAGLLHFERRPQEDTPRVDSRAT